MKSSRLLSVVSACTLVLSLGLSGCSGTQDLDNDVFPQETVSATNRQMMEGNWAPETRARIQAVINANADKGRYAVFDFDNTSVIFDIQEALLVYQIENLMFKIAPDDMEAILETGIPDVDKDMGKSEDGKTITPKSLATDIANAYSWLHENYVGFKDGGKKDLKAIHDTDEYQEFSTKLRYMYGTLGDYFDHAVSYPWVGYLFTGMTSDDVQLLASSSHKYWAKYGKYEEVTWTSPKDIKSESGVVEVSYTTGLTFTDELLDLYATLHANKIDVYIVSASPFETVLAADNTMGYEVPEDHVFAMQYKKDKDGKYTNEYNYDWGGKGKYAQTQGEGKSTIIKNFIAPANGDKGPLMVFGDSAGDMYMMTDWMDKGDTELGVIFNRYRKPSDEMTWKASVEASKTIGDKDAKFVLQGRDENKGQLRPSETSILLGTDEEVLVRPAK